MKQRKAKRTDSGSTLQESRSASSNRDLKSIDVPCYVVKSTPTERRALRSQSLGWLSSEAGSVLGDSQEEGDDDEDGEGEEETIKMPVDRHSFVLAACMMGGDYEVSGVMYCGPVVVRALATLGFGRRLVLALKQSLKDGPHSVPLYDDKTWMPRVSLNESEWHKRRGEVVGALCKELRTNESGMLSTKKAALASQLEGGLLSTKDSISVLASYIWPRTTLHILQQGREDHEFRLPWHLCGNVSRLSKSAIFNADIGRSTPNEKQKELGFDLVRLLIIFRTKFKFTDDVIRQKVQGTLSEGIIIRKLIAEQAGAAQKGKEGESVDVPHILQMHKAKTTAELGFEAAPSPTKANPRAAMTAPSRSFAKKSDLDSLVALKEISLIRDVQSRQEYRMLIDEANLDALVTHILGRLQMPPPSPEKPTSKAGATPWLGDSVDMEAASAASSPSKRKAEFKEGERRVWLPSEALAGSAKGRELIERFDKATATKAASKAAKEAKRSASAGRGTFQRVLSSSTESSMQQSSIKDFLSSPATSPTKVSPTKVLARAAKGKAKAITRGVLSDSSSESEESATESAARRKGLLKSSTSSRKGLVSKESKQSKQTTGKDVVFAKFFDEGSSSGEEAPQTLSKNVAGPSRSLSAPKLKTRAPATRALTTSSVSPTKRTKHRASLSSTDFEGHSKGKSPTKKRAAASPVKSGEAIVIDDDSPKGLSTPRRPASIISIDSSPTPRKPSQASETSSTGMAGSNSSPDKALAGKARTTLTVLDLTNDDDDDDDDDD